jgi:hypothetical protein
MAAEYHVRIKGKVHGPFSGVQIKKLADKGQVTEEAEVGTSPTGPWFPATRVAGLFDDATPAAEVGSESNAEAKSNSSSKPAAKSSAKPAAKASAKPARREREAKKSTRKAGSTSSSSTSRRKESPARRKPKRRKKAAVDASDVFDLDDSEDDVEFLDDDDDDLFDDADDFEDDDDGRPARRPSRGRDRGRDRGRSRSRGGTSWGQVRVGLLLIGIAVCVYTGAYALQVLAEAIGYLTLTSGRPPSEGTAKLIEMSAKGAVVLALLANVLVVVGASMSVFLPGDKGAKGLAIASLATIGVHLLTHFLYIVQPMIEASRPSGPFGKRGFSPGMGGDPEIEFVLTWLPYYAGLILISCTLWAIARIKKEPQQGASCVGNIVFIGIYVGLLILGYLVGKLDLIPAPKSATSAKAMVYLGILLRLGHLSLLGIYLGRLIPQTFYAKDSV